MTASISTVQERLDAVQNQITVAANGADRDPTGITLVAVSKTVGWPEIQQVYSAGIRHFGENRVQDVKARLPENMPDDLYLHMIGQLQSNKARDALRLFDQIDSVDRHSLIVELERQAERMPRSVPVLLQVNIAGEEQKAGCRPDEALGLARVIVGSPMLSLRGLMTMAPFADDPEPSRSVFRGLRLLRDTLQQELGHALPELSMGMSNDFQTAIEEGSTSVRVGRAIFGP